MVLKNNLENIALTSKSDNSSPKELGYILLGGFACAASLNISAFVIYETYKFFEKYLFT